MKTYNIFIIFYQKLLLKFIFTTHYQLLFHNYSFFFFFFLITKAMDFKPRHLNTKQVLRAFCLLPLTSRPSNQKGIDWHPQKRMKMKIH